MLELRAVLNKVEETKTLHRMMEELDRKERMIQEMNTAIIEERNRMMEEMDRKERMLQEMNTAIIEERRMMMEESESKERMMRGMHAAMVEMKRQCDLEVRAAWQYHSTTVHYAAAACKSPREAEKVVEMGRNNVDEVEEDSYEGRKAPETPGTAARQPPVVPHRDGPHDSTVEERPTDSSCAPLCLPLK